MEKLIFKPETPSSSSSSSSSTVQVVSPSSSGRRRSSASNSPEFEFWMVRNPSFPQPKLLSADELFSDGVLLPLHLLPNHSEPPDPEGQKTPNPESEPGPGPESSAVLTESSTVLSTSKRWRDIFKIGEKKTTTPTSSTVTEDKEKEKEKEKEKKKERKSGGGGVIGTELNINIWPFSRSHSAGNGGNRPKLASAAAATRKVSSAPCSRSNSAGESKSRKWPSSPGRGGVHLGRTSPVWQVRRGASGLKNSDRTGTPVVRNVEKGGKKEVIETRRKKNNGGGGGGGEGGARARVLNLNVPMCIGYRHHLSCRSDANTTAGSGGGSSNGRSAGSGGGASAGGATSGNSVGGLLNLRTIFSKKVY